MYDELIENIEYLLANYMKIFSDSEIKDLYKNYLNLKKNTNCPNFNVYEKFSYFFGKVWKNQLTDINNYISGSNFKLVVTVPTSKNPDNISSKKIISASMITDKSMGTFNNISCGLICSVDESNFICVSENDINSIVMENNSRLARSYYKIKDLNNNEGIYSKTKKNLLIFPKQIEFFNMKENIRKTGNILLSSKSTVYNDMILDKDTTNFIGIFKISPMREEDIELFQILERKYNLPVIDIKIDEYKKKYNVIPSDNSLNTITYNLTDINFLKFLINLEDKKELLNSNLIYEKISYNIKIIDTNNNNCIWLNEITKKLVIHISYIEDYLEIDFSTNNLIFMINSQIVTEDYFSDIINQKKIQLK